MKIKNVLIIILLNLVGVDLFGQCTGGTLVWNDEFSGSTLDMTKWGYQLGDGCPSLCGWGNSELEYYTNSTSNTYITGGNLVLKVIKQATGGSSASFTSGKILSAGLFYRTYGRFEASIRMPKGNGLWPAFWMLPEVNNWPTTGEIDITEYRGDINNRTSATLHYGNPWPNDKYYGTDYLYSTDLAAAFHTYAVEWDVNEIRFYFDNYLIRIITRIPNSLNPASNNANVWPWNTNFHIIFNMAVGGWFTGTTDPNTVVLTKPTMEVDYVRVYDMTPVINIQQTPYNGTPAPIPGIVQAEEYDRGCDQAAYYDTDLPNQGGVFRGERVDIEACTDAGGGYDIGWTANTEWMEYTVNVASTGTYDLAFRVAGTSAGQLHVEMDGTNITGLVNIPNTGSYTTWQSVMASNKSMTAGTHIMRVYFDVAGFNLNYVNITTNSVAPITLIDFSVKKQTGHNDLSWTTASEINNDYFTLERSYDLTTWDVIAIVKSAGSGQSIREYNQKDYAARGTIAYYRLNQTDFDGKNVYSEIIEVRMDEDVKIYPNPFSGEVSVSFPQATTQSTIIDATGNVVSTIAASNDVSTVLLGENWSKGVYMLKLSDGRVFKIVKQ